MIRLRELRRTFAAPGRKIVAAVNVPRLDLPAGDRLLVTGPNGAGKTTLLHLLSGLLRPSEGTVQVDGVDLSSLAEPQLDRFRAARVGYLPQRVHFLEGLTAAQNVMAPMLFAGVPRTEHRGRAVSLLERFGVEHRAEHLPSALSGGERQRLALARALACSPPRLLADEPTAGLDEDGRERFVEDLERLQVDDGVTLVVVTHRPGELPGAARILPMTPGESASVEEIG